MKKILALVMALAMVLAMASFASAEDITLRVWVGDNNDEPWIQGVIKNFKAAYPDDNYTIEVGVVSEGDCSKNVLNDVTVAADVFTFADDQFNSLYNGGALQQVVEGADEIIANNTPESIAASMDAEGNLYAYPATADNGYFMFYNKAYFSEEDVQSFNKMLEVAAAAEKQVGFEMSGAWYLYSFFKGAGLDMHVLEDGVTNTCNWNATDTPITGVQVVEALLDITASPAFANLGSAEFVSGIKDGSVIAGVSGTWNAAAAAEAWGEDYAACKLPTFTCAGQEVQMASFSGFKLVGVNAYSENVGAAMDFAAFMTNKESQESRFEIRRQGPSNIEALASEVVQAEPAIAAIVAQAPYADVQRVGGKYWDPAATLGKIIADGNPDGIDLQEMLDTAVAGITADANQ